MSELLAAFLVGAIAGGVTSLGHKWRLQRDFYKISVDLEDLKERLYIEMKKRASSAARRQQEFEAEALRATSTSDVAPKAPQFWWQGYIPENKT